MYFLELVIFPPSYIVYSSNATGSKPDHLTVEGLAIPQMAACRLGIPVGFVWVL